MTRYTSIIITGLLLLLANVGCKEPYNAPINVPSAGYLVVDGYINNDGPTTITLTRSTRLYDSVDLIYESNADVRVEGEHNESYPLFQTTGGVYTSTLPALNPSEKYRVHITTKNGKEYASDYSAVRTTPEIDSISWLRDNGVVRIYINTHDDQNKTKYYRWSYSETWEFHAAYLSSLDWEFFPGTDIPWQVQGRSPGSRDSLYRCWKTVNSSNIFLGSSEKLSADKIYLPLRYIEPNAEELSVLYYIKINQYAVSNEAYSFYEKLKKNTEQLGSIFDAQPSDLSGNVHSISDPAETVVGFVEVSETRQKDIFISNAEVTPWGQVPACGKIVIYNHPDSIKPYVDGYIPISPVLMRGLAIVKFDAAPPICVDCTLRGTNTKPSFWP